MRRKKVEEVDYLFNLYKDRKKQIKWKLIGQSLIL